MRVFTKSLQSAAFLCLGTAALAQDAGAPLPDPTHIPFTLPDNISWEGDAARGEQQYKVFGDPTKPGWYEILLKWYPNHFSKPHFHPNVRYITVLSGHSWVSSNNVYDPSKTYPLGPGTIARDEANTVHWDGAKDEPVVLEIVGEGPAPNINVDETGKPLPPRNGGGAQASAAPPPQSGPRARYQVQPGDYNRSDRTVADENLPQPYDRNETFFKFPKGRILGATSAIDIDRDGKSIWIMERCGGQDFCFGPNAHVPPIMKFDSKGNFIKAFGADMVVYPHGLHVDRQGNIWIADENSNVDFSALRSHTAPADAPASPRPSGADVLKFSPKGKLLMTLGVPGVYGSDETHLSQPSAVETNANGDIFVADGHDTQPSNSRIVKYDRSGKFIKAWSSCGTNPTSMLDCNHALTMDSQGRLFVGNRGNSRIEIFDQEGNLLAEWKQFGKPSGMYIDKHDILYVADSESSVREHNSFVRGIHIGSAKTGEVTAFIPDPGNNPAPWNPERGTSGSEGVAVDKEGIIYATSVTPPVLAKYTLKKNAAP